MAKRPVRAPAPDNIVRCAIYTRKSTEEGLEQEFNSLDAQYEACAAYISSQRHEGWTQVRDRYADGGFSGGNMDRPGLTRLLADVASGKVNVIVLYKVDRLTRSLADFSKIVEVLDAAGASFVSITQAFNTTTSMGRLMLNVLLSFAQFEREITGERIRDKIAASKKKGMWMGGNPPLGYDVFERKLVVNEAEANTVRHIFERYAALGSGSALIAELREQGYRSKLRVREGKSDVGGMPFERGMLFHMLGNRAYLGETVHQGVAYPGEHYAIVEPALWQAVQDRILANSVERSSDGNAQQTSLLVGIIKDGLGRRMSPSHAVKKGKRYRYYITHASELRPDTPPAWRLPARDVEDIAVARLSQLLLDRRSIRSAIGRSAADAMVLQRAMSLASETADRLGTSYGRRSLISRLVTAVQVTEHTLSMTINRVALDRLLAVEHQSEAAPMILIAPAMRVRRGKDVKLVFATGDGQAQQPDQKLLALIEEAIAARAAILEEPGRSMRDAASALGQCRHRLGQLVRLSYLAPTIVKAIADGRHPASLTPRVLLSSDLPLAWKDQKAMLEFA